MNPAQDNGAWIGFRLRGTTDLFTKRSFCQSDPKPFHSPTNQRSDASKALRLACRDKIAVLPNRDEWSLLDRRKSRTVLLLVVDVPTGRRLRRAFLKRVGRFCFASFT
jgi:hypothetical protein